jgi:hypothetical protein
MPRSEERAAKNEVAFRRANESIDDRRRSLGLASATPYLCECEDERCTELVRLTPSEYVDARADARRFIVAPGHEHRDRLVESNPEYLVVEKSGRGGEIAEETAG